MCASADDPTPRVDYCAVEVSAGGDRQSVEAIYLELRHLAREHGLKIDYELKQGADDPSPQATGSAPA